METALSAALLALRLTWSRGSCGVLGLVQLWEMTHVGPTTGPAHRRADALLPHRGDLQPWSRSSIPSRMRGKWKDLKVWGSVKRTGVMRTPQSQVSLASKTEDRGRKALGSYR